LAGPANPATLDRHANVTANKPPDTFSLTVYSARRTAGVAQAHDTHSPSTKVRFQDGWTLIDF